MMNVAHFLCNIGSQRKLAKAICKTKAKADIMFVASLKAVENVNPGNDCYKRAFASYKEAYSIDSALSHVY